MVANRFNVVRLKEQHTDEAGDEHEGYVHIRPADQGLTDAEFDKGARIIDHDMPSASKSEAFWYAMNYAVLSTEQWNEMINGDADLPNDRFAYPKQYDKWDSQREIW